MRRQTAPISTIAGRIAFGNTDLANKFLIQANYGPSRTPEEIAYKLNNYIVAYGDEALEGLAEIHPDREQILATVKKENEPAPQIQNMGINGFHNFNGGYSNCSGGCNCNKPAPQTFNASGDEPQLKSTNLLDQKSIMMIGLFCITAISIVALTRKGN